MRYSSAQVYKMTDDAYVCACARASALNQRMLISEASEHEPVMFFKKKKNPSRRWGGTEKSGDSYYPVVFN